MTPQWGVPVSSRDKIQRTPNRKDNDLRWKAPLLKTIWSFDYVTKRKSFYHFTNWKYYISTITRLMVSKFARGTAYEKGFSTQTLIDFFSIFNILPKIMVTKGLLLYCISWLWSQEINQHIDTNFVFTCNENI